jgi:Pyruvate/2-oxoacid:ferredoxin oxidoreductase delta subunit
MGLTRILLIALVVWLVVVFVRRQLGKTRRRPEQTQAKLVRCARCGVYLPESETKPDANQARICAHH